MHNLKKFKYVFITFKARITLRLHFTKILENFSHVLAYHYVMLT